MLKNNGKNILFLLLCLLLITVALVSFGCNEALAEKNVATRGFSCSQSEIQTTENVTQVANKKNYNIELLCLMYHNVVADNQKQGDYEIRVSSVERDFADLKQKGYKCVGQKQLLEIVDNQKKGKYVMITFDDGFFGVYKYIPQLLTKYDMRCVVSVTGEFIDIADKQNYKTRCSYMNTAEVKKLAQNPRVEIAHHTYNFHHITSNRKGVKISKNESVDKYKQNFTADVKKLEKKLGNLGVKTQAFCYPFGEYCRESERTLKDMGYQITMTCNEHINYLSSRNSLYLLGRLNRSAKYQNLDKLLQAGCKK